MYNNTKAFAISIALAIAACISEEGLANDGDDMFATSLRRTDQLDALQGELIVERGHYITRRLGVSFFASTETDLHWGYEMGIRTRMRSRFSPFIGAGVFAGSRTTYEPAASDGIDNDNDSFIDEPGEKRELTEYLLAAYPEAGLHIWLTDSVRITGTCRYYFTTAGRHGDAVLYGLELGIAMK